MGERTIDPTLTMLVLVRGGRATLWLVRFLAQAGLIPA
jgi:hypothetical protein